MSSESITLITAIIGAVCGVAGATLGIINTLHQIQRNKVRLKVTPKNIFPFGAIQNANINFGIEVINLSDFPVVVSDVGFLLKDKQHATTMLVNSIDQPEKLPIKLEPRTSYTKCFDFDGTEPPNNIKCAYASTQCGEFITGTSGALKQKIKEVRG